MSKQKKKKCNWCGKRKTLGYFNKCTTTKDGIQPRCRKCEAKYYIDNKKRLTDGYLLYRYGLTPAEKRLIYGHQDRRCPVCGKKILLKNTHVDHCHKISRKNKKRGDVPAGVKKKSIRGLLCRKCNIYIIGTLDRFGGKKLLEMVNAAILYTEKPPAQEVLDN